MALGACSLALDPCFVEPGRLKLLTIDQDPGAKALPGIAHDLELSRDGQQLSLGCMTYFYCEFFSQEGPYIPWRSTV